MYYFLDPKMMHPHMSVSILQIIILLNHGDKRCKEIILISFHSSASAFTVILKFGNNKWGKMYLRNMLWIFLIKKRLPCTGDHFEHNLH